MSVIDTVFCEKYGIVNYGAWGFECIRNGKQAIHFNAPRQAPENWNSIAAWVQVSPALEVCNYKECDGSVLSKHFLHCPECHVHLTSLLMCHKCGVRYGN
jgi:hypothetical protein